MHPGVGDSGSGDFRWSTSPVSEPNRFHRVSILITINLKSIFGAETVQSNCLLPGGANLHLYQLMTGFMESGRCSLSSTNIFCPNVQFKKINIIIIIIVILVIYIAAKNVKQTHRCIKSQCTSAKRMTSICK